jgi:hypothetical protein
VTDSFGDAPRRQNPGMARALTDTGGGPLPAKGSTARRLYDNALRRVNRWRTTAAQRRRPSPGDLAQLRDLARRHLGGDTAGRVTSRGAWMRLTAWIRVSQRWELHTMPSDAAGKPRWQHITGTQMAAPVGGWMEGAFDAAGTELLTAFFAAYWGDPDPCEVGQILRVELRE